MELREYGREERGVSWFGAIVSWIAGLVLQVPIYRVLDMKLFEVPGTMVIFLWVVIMAVIMTILDFVGI